MNNVATTEQQAFEMVVALHRLVRSLRHAVREDSLQPTQTLVLTQLVSTGPMRVGELAAGVSKRPVTSAGNPTRRTAAPSVS